MIITRDYQTATEELREATFREIGHKRQWGGQGEKETRRQGDKETRR